MRINIANETKTAEALKVGQGRSTARIVTPKQLHRIGQQADRALDGATLAERRGTRVTYCEHAYGPHAYAQKRFGGMSTHVTLERGSRDWFLVGVSRVWVPTITSPRNIDMTIHASSRAIDAALYTVQYDRGLVTADR